MTVTKAELEADLHQAMRSGDSLKKSTLRLVLTAIKLAEVEVGGELDGQSVQRVLQKEAKSRRETIADAKAAGRDDLRAAAEDELAILEDYLPKQLSQDEIRSIAAQAISDSGASGPEDMGRVMGVVMGKTKGRADGSQVSKIVRDLLSES